MFNLHKNVYLFLKIVVEIRFLFIICVILGDQRLDLVSNLSHHQYKQQPGGETHTNNVYYAISSLFHLISPSHYMTWNVKCYQYFEELVTNYDRKLICEPQQWNEEDFKSPNNFNMTLSRLFPSVFTELTSLNFFN